MQKSNIINTKTELLKNHSRQNIREEINYLKDYYNITSDIQLIRLTIHRHYEEIHNKVV